MKKYIIEMRRGLKWKKTWWTVPKGTHPFPVTIPPVDQSQAKKCLRIARMRFPETEYRIAEVLRER